MTRSEAWSRTRTLRPISRTGTEYLLVRTVTWENRSTRGVNQRPVSKSVTATNLADAKKQGAVLAYGSFITLTLNFIIIAFVLFIVIRLMNQLKRQQQAALAAPPKPSREEELLAEIRDLLKKA